MTGAVSKVLEDVPMNRQSLVTLAALLGLASCSTGVTMPKWASRIAPKPAEQTLTATRVWPGEIQILAVLDAQKAAWNRGDIDTFMEGYWKSEELRFASGGTVLYGWQATLDRYNRTYSSRDAMGMLDFSDLEVSVTSESAAIVHGRWALERISDQPNGLFTLAFQKFGDDWLIISDTTTSADGS